MKKLLLLPALLFCVFTAGAQYLPCLYDLAVEHMENQYPGYREHVQRGIQGALEDSRAKNEDELYTVPVVVHVVWKETSENIPLDRIEAQIDALNKAYRRQNADTVNTREIFYPVVGDAGIEFVLVDVIRVQTNEFFQPTFTFAGITLPDKVKRTAQGGSDAVDPIHHLNIWICAIRPLTILGNQSPILGYAYPPAGLPHWPAGASAPSLDLEGVVVDYRVVGDSLSYQAYGLGPLPMRGRTMVHEVAHYLGLRHISGDGLLGLLGINDCDADDGVEDTPQQGRQSQFICNHQQNTCDDGPGDLPDMVENYMDYSLETCQNSFTQGQIDIMRAVLEGPRIGLLNSPSSTNDANDLADKVSVFPNPTYGLLQMQFPGQRLDRIVLLTPAGKALRVLRGPFFDTHQLDLQGLPAGMYFLRMEQDGQVAVKKAVRN